MGRPIKTSLKKFCEDNPNYRYLLNEYNKAENYLSANDIGSQDSRKIMKWVCEKGHTFESHVNNRIVNKANCPFCSGRRIIIGENDLKTTHPQLCKDWDYTSNNSIPEQYSSGMHDDIQWNCHKCGHKWPSRIDSRVRRGCPKCSSRSQTSFPEQVVYLWAQENFKNVQNRYKIGNVEYDIFIQDIKLVIEYDGFTWHEGKETKHQEKLNVATTNGMSLVNIVELKKNDKTPLQRYGIKHRILPYTIKGNYSNIQQLIENLSDIFQAALKRDFKPLTKEIIQKAKENSKVRSTIENSLAENYPDLAEFWDYEKNDMLPEEVSRGSGEEVHWKCPDCNTELPRRTPHYMVSRFKGCNNCGKSAYSYKGYVEDAKITSSRVKLALVFDKRLADATFTDILKSVILSIYQNNSPKIQLIVDSELLSKKNSEGKIVPRISLDNTKFYQPHLIEDTGIYLETKMSTSTTLSVIKQIIQLCECEKKVYIEI